MAKTDSGTATCRNVFVLLGRLFCTIAQSVRKKGVEGEEFYAVHILLSEL